MRDRFGLLVQKIGMSAIYQGDGSRIGVTLLKLSENCQIVGHKTLEKDGYTAVQLGVGEIKAKNLSNPQKGFYAKNKVLPKKKVCEFRVKAEAMINVGSEISVDHFVKGQYVDVTGISIGKGFAGGMKRHNFRGLEASHGVSVSHRSIGSTGQRQDPGKVFKGKKMPGHMGDKKVTIQNIQVMEVDSKKGLIFVKGSVPGSKNGYLVLKDAIKRALPDNAPFPTNVKIDDNQKDNLDGN